ncbi:leucine-rich repeat serine/threonine-protein kinase 1-like isoform X2 [Oscarella lobularis]
MKARSGEAWLIELQYPASFWANERILLMIDHEFNALEPEACVESALRGLNNSLQQKVDSSIDKYVHIVRLLIQKGASIQSIGSLVTKYPLAVAHILSALRARKSNDDDDDAASDHFILKGSHLPSLPRDVIDVVRSNDVRRIDVSDNAIESLPVQLFQLPNVQWINAANNRLVDVPSPSEWRCGRLATLNLNDNLLTGVEPMNALKSVYELSIKPFMQAARRALHSLSGSQVFQPLEQRSADRDCLRHLARLANVKLVGNRLQMLPEWVTRLPDLKSIDLRCNASLVALPPQLVQFSKDIISINVDGLELICPPMCEVRRGTGHVRCYLNSQLRNASLYSHIQLMLVGRCAVGKTTLLRRLQSSRLVNRHQRNVSTVGVDMATFSYRPNVGARSVTFNALDFAGQEDYYATHQCFFRKSAIYMALVDLRVDAPVGVGGLAPWLLSIQACAPGACVLIVGTHVDLIEAADDVIKDYRTEIESRFYLDADSSVAARHGMPRVVDFVAVSSVTGVGVRALKRRLYDAAFTVPFPGCELPFLDIPVPGCLIFIRDCLQGKAINMRRDGAAPVLTRAEFEDFVRRHPKNDIADERELGQATRFLHELGVVLHYETATNDLQNLYFIDVQFLSAAMACVITSPERRLVKHGILDDAALPVLFKGHVPSTLQRHVMQLMEAFEVVVALDGARTRFLVPSMLPVKKPDLDPDGTCRCVRRIYLLSYVPVGFWSRLISRLVIFTQALGHALTAATGDEGGAQLEFDGSHWLCWQRGFRVRFVDDDSYVVVEEFDVDRSILVTVGGMSREARARRLVAVVQNVDTLIEEFYPGLCQEPCVATKLVPCPKCAAAVCDDVRDDRIHRFVVDDLIEISKREDDVVCEGTCSSTIDLADLVPDVALLDLPEDLRLDTFQLQLNPSDDNCLGEGGFGKVYRAVYRGRNVALKLFNVDAAAEEDYRMMYQELRSEVHILSRLDHPSIVKLKGVCRRPLCVALELAPAGSLNGILKERRGVGLESLVAQQVAIQIISAIAYLHSLTIIYRDLKPHNVLVWSLDLQSGVRVKLADYGIARFSSAAGLKQMTGTEAYMAPEMWKTSGQATYDEKIDIYSFGLVFFEIVTGLNAFWQFDSRWDMITAVSDGFRPSIDDALKSRLPKDENSTSLHSRARPDSSVADPHQRWHPLFCVKMPARRSRGFTVKEEPEKDVSLDSRKDSGSVSLDTVQCKISYARKQELFASADSGFHAGNENRVIGSIELEETVLCQPYVQNLLNACLSVNPADRPTASDLIKNLTIYPTVYSASSSSSRLDALGLRRAIPVADGTALLFGDRRISIVSGDEKGDDLLHVDVVPFEDDGGSSRFSCVAVIDDSLWIGYSDLSSCAVAAYDVSTFELTSSLAVSSVPLSFAKWNDGVVVGFDDGRLMGIRRSSDLGTLSSCAEGILDDGPIVSLYANDDVLIAARGTSLVRLHVDSLTEIDRWPVEQKSRTDEAILADIVPCDRGIWTRLVRGIDVKLWNVTTGKIGQCLRRITEISADDVDMYITSLTCANGALWVGMSSGWISVYDVPTGAAIASSNVYGFVDLLVECRFSFVSSSSSRSSMLSLGKMRRDGGVETVFSVWSTVC